MAYTTINKPNLHFNTLTYTGDAVSPRTVTGVGFKPDFTWIKNRTRAGNTALNDNVRGVGTGAYKALSTEGTGAEGANGESGYGYVSAYASDGFTLTTGSTAYDIVNRSGDSYVSWNWLASGTTAVSNTTGTISSTVSANATAGFSIVSWTGNGTSGATVGHGLGVTPKMFIVKNRTVAGAWLVQHAGLTGQPQANSSTITLGSGNANGMVLLSNSGGEISYGFDGQMNGSGNSMIAYCFSEVKGYSKFGSYTGNGSTDGTFVYTGFKPAFLIVKRKDSSTTNNWRMWDNKRSPSNAMCNFLYHNLNNDEDVDVTVDFLSNGFKFRNASVDNNGSGSNYIYIAFAEQPLVGTNNVPATAR